MSSRNENFDIRTWKNWNNIKSYNSIPAAFLMENAKKGGLDNGCDIDVIQPYINKSNSILELGAGYGRVLQQLVNRNFQGKIVGIECNPHFCDSIKKRFLKKIEIIRTNIQFLKLEYTYDLILWLWSGICDFAKQEQEQVLFNIVKCLSTTGFLILDTTPVTSKPINSTWTDGQYCLIPGKNRDDFYFYTPTSEEIKLYAKKLGFPFIKEISYLTSTNRQRVIYILARNKIC